MAARLLGNKQHLKKIPYNVIYTLKKNYIKLFTESIFTKTNWCTAFQQFITCSHNVGTIFGSNFFSGYPLMMWQDFNLKKLESEMPIRWKFKMPFSVR